MMWCFVNEQTGSSVTLPQSQQPDDSRGGEHQPCIQPCRHPRQQPSAVPPQHSRITLHIWAPYTERLARVPSQLAPPCLPFCEAGAPAIFLREHPCCPFPAHSRLFRRRASFLRSMLRPKVRLLGTFKATALRGHLSEKDLVTCCPPPPRPLPGAAGSLCDRISLPSCSRPPCRFLGLLLDSNFCCTIPAAFEPIVELRRSLGVPAVRRSRPSFPDPLICIPGSDTCEVARPPPCTAQPPPEAAWAGQCRLQGLSLSECLPWPVSYLCAGCPWPAPLPAPQGG